MFEIHDQLMEKLKCSECDGYLSCAPIMLKPDGNSICGRCEIADEDMPVGRNKCYEELASVLIFPCKFRKEGCTKKLNWDNVKRHEDQCDFRIYDCPVARLAHCNWEGPYSSLLDHYNEAHPNLVIDHPCKLKPDITKDFEENFLITVFGFLFLVQVKCISASGRIWHCVRYLGNSTFTANFEYTLEVTNCDSALMKTKRVCPRENLVIHKNNSVEVTVKTLMDFFGGYTNVYFKITVTKRGSICFRCKRDLKPLKLYCVGEEFHCQNCRTDPRGCHYDTSTAVCKK